MRTGTSYMGHHDPDHMARDLDDLASLGCDDVLLAAQEIDFIYRPGKVEPFPRLAKERGLRPIIVFWGLFNLFGGGRSSQFLLTHPGAHQVDADGARRPEGCYNHPACLAHVRSLIDRVINAGYEAYFIDEPTPLQCYCKSCQALCEASAGYQLKDAADDKEREFRRYAALRYVASVCDYVKASAPDVETQCCVMPVDESMWSEAIAIASLDNLGTDLYWVNDDRDVHEMVPSVQRLATLARNSRKKHHQWLQCYAVKQGREQRIRDQGEVLVSQQPDALYVWAYKGQVGMAESCDDPPAAWEAACEVLRLAKRSAAHAFHW